MPGKRTQFARLPDETARAARSSFNFNNLYLLIGDELDRILAKYDLEQLNPASERPVSVLSLQALVTIFQYAECLPDRWAAEATRTRMDWKYALHLPLNYPGIDPQILCLFRQRLWGNSTGQAILEQLCSSIAGLGLFSQREKGACQARKVLKGVCTVNRLDLLTEAIIQALEAVAAEQPEWLKSIALAHWYLRYPAAANGKPPRSPAEQAKLAQTLGGDARHLLEAWCAFWPPEERRLAEMQALGQVFDDQFKPADRSGGYAGKYNWRPERCASCGVTRETFDRPGSARR